jgi:transcription initiation factor IIE alpha subunit
MMRLLLEEAMTNDTMDCELCHEIAYLEDYGIILEISAGSGELVEANFLCPNCGEDFKASEAFHKIGYRVQLRLPST